MSGPKDDALTPWQAQPLTKRSGALVRRGLAEAEGLKGLDKMQPPSERSGLQEPDPWAVLRATLDRLRGDVTNSLGMKLVQIPAGKFMMGSDAEEDEKPIHEVTINKSFYMGRHPVTQSQWQEIMGNNPSKFIGDDYPVHGVSWDDAQEFIRKLNLLDLEEKYDEWTNDETRPRILFRYRLPSEGEWEYACRAGTTGDYAGPLDSIAWHERPLFGSQPHAVGTKEANAFGLYDMHGNVWEWCQDFYHQNYYSNSPITDPQGPRSGQYRVLRGGSWNCAFETALRSANRYGSTPAARVNDIGFRIVAVVPIQEP